MLSPSSKKIVLAAALLAAVVALDAWAGTVSLGVVGAEAGEPSGPRVVLLVPLAGERSDEGRSAMRGFGLAVERLLPAGTVLVPVDSRCDADYADISLDLLVSRDVPEAVVGGLCDDVAVMARRRFRGTSTEFVRLDEKTAAEATVDFPDDEYLRAYGTAADATARQAYDAARRLGL